MILLDTHVWLWLNGAVEKIPSDILETLADEPEVYLSVASAWEIAIKHATGKLSLPVPPDLYISSRMEENGISSLPIHQDHVLKAAALPTHHKDPFDRVLIAQAQVENLTLLTADPLMARYGIDVFLSRNRR